MKVYLEREDKHLETSFSGTVSELLSHLDVNPETVLVTRNNALVTEDVQLQEQDEVRLLTVLSGG